MPSRSVIGARVISAGTVAAILLWIAAVAMGAHTLLLYSNTPAAQTVPPPHWPHDSTIRPTPNRPTLLIFGHPECPCTRATLGQLAQVVAQVGAGPQAFDTYVVFSAPSTVLDGWPKTGLWQSAVSIPQVRAIIDPDGREARLFHATTSGQSLLYNARGNLLFSGGITASRGHAGPNDGQAALVALLGGGTMRGAGWHRTTPVFGCSLLGEERP